MKAKTYLFTAVAGLALSGGPSLAGVAYADTMRTTTAQGRTPFTQALTKEYRVQTSDEGEWNDAAWYARHGPQAAKGDIVLPADVTAIPKFLIAAVASFLALEGFSLLTAPPSLVREALARVQAREPAPDGSEAQSA